MSKGILIFAINSTYDYVSAAEFAATKAKQYLNLSVTLVTTEKVESQAFDEVIYIEDNASTAREVTKADGSKRTVQWFNESKVRAYELSPYDQTLLIDADYFMYNASLLTIFDTDIEIACYGEIHDITGINPPLIRLNEVSIPMQWATVLYFKKCELSKAVFDFMKLIRNDWKYYSMLYSFKGHNFRNDFALSIALQALTGYSTKNYRSLPGKLISLFSNTEVISVSDTEVTYCWNNRVSKITNSNIHCLNKDAMEMFYAV